MYIKRTLILSKINDESSKVIATIQKGENNPYLTIKANNLEEDYIFALIRYANSPIEVVKLNRQDCDYVGELPAYFDCGAEISIIVLLFSNKVVKPYYISGTISKQRSFYDEVLKDMQYYQTKCLALNGEDVNTHGDMDFIEITAENSEKTQKDMAEIEKLFEPASEEEIDNIITDTILSECLSKEDKCENCEYKKAFFENKGKENLFVKNTTVQDVDNGIEDCLDIIDGTINDEIKFYKQIEKSLQALFNSYPRDEILEKAISDSQFVKVDYENTGDYYSVGYIKENNTPKYICYAIPCKPNSPPPKDMENFSQYLLVDDSTAYYLMYQKADDGLAVDFNYT